MNANRNFHAYIEKMPKLMATLQDKPLLGLDELSDIPNSGIFVLYEHKGPLFVGRSNKLRQYLKGQGNPRSDNYNAPFAYKLAKEKAKEQSLPTMTVKESMRNTRFLELFGEAKERVAGMKVQVVGVTDPIEQTLFVIYVAIELNTPYNDFETH